MEKTAPSSTKTICKNNLASVEAPDSSGWSASQYNKAASFVYSASYVAPVLDLLDAKPGERIFDFGCGSGEVTLQIVETVGKNGLVVGVDYSESMIEKAKTNGLQHAFVCDVQQLVLPGSPSWGNGVTFDTVFSNASLHWCKRDPKAVLESAKRVLKPGGKFVGEMGGFMNCIGIRSALHVALQKRGYDPVALDPWYFPSVADYREVVVSAGFEPIHLSLHPRMTPVPEGLLAWLQCFVRHSFLRECDDKVAEEIMQEVVNVCDVDCRDGEGNWAIVYIRLRFSAILK